MGRTRREPDRLFPAEQVADALRERADDLQAGQELMMDMHARALAAAKTIEPLVHGAYRVSAKRSNSFSRRPARELQLGCIPLRRVPMR
jgi:hypothetical protein